MSEQANNRPAWMQDEAVKDIPPEKLRFLEEMFQKGHGKTQKELLKLLMPMMQRAKKENLTFTPQEMQAAISAIKHCSTEEELHKIDEILKKAEKT